MFLAVLLGIVFFVYGIYELIRGNYYESICNVVGSFALLGMFSFFLREKRKRNEFIQWIITNREQVHSRGIMSDKGYVIDQSTELVQYVACISLVFLSIKIPSRYYIKGSLSSSFARLIYILFTFLFGWWGLPHGPINTISSIYKNIRGRNKVIVGDLISEEIV